MKATSLRPHLTLITFWKAPSPNDFNIWILAGPNLICNKCLERGRGLLSVFKQLDNLLLVQGAVVCNKACKQSLWGILFWLF